MLIALGAWLSGCSSTREQYWRGDLAELDIVPPSATTGATVSADAVAAGFAREPQAKLPARIAVARLESRSTEPRFRRSSGHGGASAELMLANKADPTTTAAYQRLAALPEVSDLTPLNTLIANPRIESQESLRASAASLQADLLYVYTFDSYVRSHTALSGLLALSLGLLGFLPTTSIEVESTASGALIDVRSGYVYGVANVAETSKKTSSMWNEDDDLEDVREQAECAAFEKLTAEFEQRWKTHVAGIRSVSPR
jgi:hypothetical protein